MKIATSQERLIELFDSDPRTDTAIAKELCVSKQTISAWRTGTRSPKKAMLVKIANIYHVSIEWLMGFAVNRNEQRTAPNTDIYTKLILGMTPKLSYSKWRVFFSIISIFLVVFKYCPTKVGNMFLYLVPITMSAPISSLINSPAC